MNLKVEMFNHGENDENFALKITAIAESPAEHLALRSYCSPHRPTTHAIPLEQSAAWEALSTKGEFEEAGKLHRPTLVLWSNDLVFTYELKGAIHCFYICLYGLHGVIADSLIIRLKHAECVDEVVICLQQLILEIKLQDYAIYLESESEADRSI